MQVFFAIFRGEKGIIKRRRRQERGVQRDVIPLAGGETEGDSVPLRSSLDSEAISGRLIFTSFPRLDRHMILPVKPGYTFAERLYSIASLAVLLFRRGSAPPRTPPCQRNNIPLDSHYLPPPAL